MIFKAKLNLNTLINKTLSSVELLTKPRKAFFIEIMFLFMSIKGKMNFYQFGRYGNYAEQRYRQQFEKQFNFINFNIELTRKYGSNNFAIGFDPSYISKSGKKTPGLGRFWSGVAGHTKLGLEIGGIAAIDIDNNTAFHIEAVQTPNQKELKEDKMTLLDWYGNVLYQRKDELLQVSKYVVADAYFSKRPFADKMNEAGFHLVSRFRKDADLMYLFKGKPTGKKGRPRIYNGKVNLNDIDKNYFKLEFEHEDSNIYSAVVYSRGLKRNIKLIYQELVEPKKKSYLLFFSTDQMQDAKEIFNIYKSRFQIEFLYRDGKQHTGLNDSQARSKNKLHFHFNASLTAINLAKIEYWFSLPQEKRAAFSMANVKTLHHNTLLLERFIEVFAINPNKVKNMKHIKELMLYGKIAA
ncbi:MAG: transposase [Flavobacteriales bacterium]|nr:transposase [Flavobacteriales bacterium]